MVSKSVLTTFLSWVEHVEALGFTQQQIDKLADEYLDVQGVSTYAPPPELEHTLRGDSIGMGIHERWYCSCGAVYRTRIVAEAHAEFANASF